MDLPEEIQLKILSYISSFGPCWSNDDIPLARCVPYRQSEDDRNDDPLQGFRSSPFIGQVCKLWKRLLETQSAQALLHRHVVLDFGHELLNGMYWPLRFQSTAMTEDEFFSRLAVAKLSVSKMREHVMRHRKVMSALTVNVEGLWHRFLQGDQPVDKHTSFDEGDLCFLLGLVVDQLQELHLHNRYGRLRLESSRGVWSSISACTGLTRLHIRTTPSTTAMLPQGMLEQLSALKGLQELSITGHSHALVRMMPPQWSCLTCLTSLDLSMARRLVLPAWLPKLPLLRLHISTHALESTVFVWGNDEDMVILEDNLPHGSVAVLAALRGLEVLALQDVQLVDGLPLSAVADTNLVDRPLQLPDLAPLAPSLKVLSLTGTRLRRLPPQIFRLTSLEILDLRDNESLWVLADMSPLLAQYPHLRLLDWRGLPPWHRSASGLHGEPLASPYLSVPALTLRELHWMCERRGLLELLYGQLWSWFEELRVAHGVPDNWRDDPDQYLLRLNNALMNNEAWQTLDGSEDKLRAWMGATKLDNCMKVMRDHLWQAQHLVYARQPWRPASAARGGGCMPEWRMPSAGGRHGPGPWMLMSHEELWNALETGTSQSEPE